MSASLANSAARCRARSDRSPSPRPASATHPADQPDAIFRGPRVIAKELGEFDLQFAVAQRLRTAIFVRHVQLHKVPFECFAFAVERVRTLSTTGPQRSSNMRLNSLDSGFSVGDRGGSRAVR